MHKNLYQYKEDGNVKAIIENEEVCWSDEISRKSSLSKDL
jgi:hypothetical protein